ncbi:hypothetical protein [Phaeovulum vinaykumarii]|uniref:Uncharacterized protein n=1 Tax=Phaeovulum vinaykumarii TaxID=407234 RepID=A0A1N7L296_9RHOB|nr:hypothetical protein [Phaeovulum vinaykumarii]SIS67978.1 hypothetical protein SAMN05421795_102462 [Phaeovulum vinaykumarii]SOC00430.1 hypothetical protein SAMN05878426_102310 [Phaeovulum vinaykumarii]
MISRIAGAFVRAWLVALVIALPALILPGMSADSTQVVALIALFAAVLTFFEYASVYPGLIEFRHAPPFNRIRYVSLLVTVLLLSALAAGQTEPSTLTRLVEVTGRAVVASIDFPYSPVRLLTLMLPADTPAAHLELVRSAAGLAYIVSLITLGYFVIILRLLGWPTNAGGFNVWVNLPTFDPTAGGDVVDRLRRDAAINVGLGFLLPFVIPALLKAGADAFEPVTLASEQTMIWTVTAWAFLPASVFMRGIAMGRIATLIENKRRARARADEGGFVHA